MKSEKAEILLNPVDWRNDIKWWLRRRDVRWLLIGVFLVVLAQLFFVRLNYRGPVALEFVRCVHRGTNWVDGTIVEFRLINQSGATITYSGEVNTSPTCEVIPMAADEFRVFGGTLPHETSSFYLKPIEHYEIANGEERIIYALVVQAEQSWRLKMNYQEGKVAGNWVDRLPAFAQSLFIRDEADLPENTAISEPVHRLIPWTGTSGSYFLTGHRTNRNGRITAVESVKLLEQWEKDNAAEAK